MGGFGSGPRRGGKNTTRDLRALDIRRLQRDGLLTSGRSFNWQWSISGEKVADINIRIDADNVILNYRCRSNGGEWQQVEYPVFLEWTACSLGGRRAWFLCPGRGCGRRVAILFGGSIFACRHCHALAYQCQRETYDDRAMRRAEKIRRRLGWEPGIANPEGSKPKGMHWRTFRELKAEHDTFAEESWMGLAKRLGLMGGDRYTIDTDLLDLIEREK